MAVDPNNVKSIFLAASEKPSAERAGFLDQVVAGDATLRRRVEALLRAHDNPDSFLEDPAAGFGATIDMSPAENPLTERVGARIGPYKLLEQIGEGGMGIVFMAEQAEPLQRTVALKIIKPGMDTRQVIARFEAERQALAMMDHPNIARVVDAGTTETGRPYFVMDLVKGVPITHYCDQQHLSVRHRLDLMTEVCQAVQHAHQKGIIHRDLKPSNVLVAEYDGKPVPKVIDFGVAKATAQRLTEHTMFTQYGQIVGTFEYMSPEQARFNQLDVDTRSDIYSLGVLLYELLAGSTPLEKERLRSAEFDEVLRMICDEEAPRPSLRLSSSAELPTISAQRQIEPAKLKKVVGGELDWIVMKCLEKDRNRRYETASRLSDDIQCYLNDGPVQACPPSAIYRLRKFATRNRSALVFASSLLLIPVLLGGSGGWMLRDRSARQSVLEQGVNRLLDESRQWQMQGKWPEALATVERAETLVVNSDNRAEVGDRVKYRLADLRMLTKLDDIRGLCESGEELADFSRGDADQAYASAFTDFGIDINALDTLDSARRIRARSVPIELAAALDHWALIRKWQNRDLDAQRLLSIARAVDNDYWRNRLRDTLQVADSESKEVLELATVAPPHELLPATLVLLGTALESGDRREQAFSLLSKAQRKYPNDFWVNWRLASCALLLDRWEDAIRFYSVAQALRPDRPEVYARMGGALGQDMRLDEGITEINEAMRLRPDYPRAYASITWLLATHPDPAQRRPAQAIEYAQKGLKLQPQHPNSWSNLGVAYYAAGEWGKAADALEKANRMMSGADHFHRFYLAMARWRVGNKSNAREAYEQGIQWMEQKHQAHQEMLLHSRAEAADVLGITEEKMP